MVPIDCLAVALAFVWCLMSCYGHIVADVDNDVDDIWPVLCPPDTYYSRSEEQCLICSECPMNKIIIIPCHGLHDTKCGPFYDFQDVISADTKSRSLDSLRNLAVSDNITHKMSHSDSSAEIVGTLSDSSRHESARNWVSYLSKTSQGDVDLPDSEWKSLTVTLFVLLSVFVVTVCVWVIIVCRRRDSNQKTLISKYNPPPEEV